MTTVPYSHAPSTSESTSASSATTITQIATTPPHAGVVPPRTNVVIPQAQKQVESWKFNPAYKGRHGEASWIPGQSMPHREQLQVVRQGSFNRYKFVPQPPSAEYLAMKLSDNPLGLTNIAPVSIEGSYFRGQLNLASDDDANIDRGDGGSLSMHPSPGGLSILPLPSSNLPLISSSATSILPLSSTIPQHAANLSSTTPHLQDPNSYNATVTQAHDKGTSLYHSSSLKPTFSLKIVQTPMDFQSSSGLRESTDVNLTTTAPKGVISSSPRAFLTSPDIGDERDNGKEKDMHIHSDADESPSPLAIAMSNLPAAGNEAVSRTSKSPMTNGTPKGRMQRREYTHSSDSPPLKRNLYTANASNATMPGNGLATSTALHALSTSLDTQRLLRVRRGYWNKRGDHLTLEWFIVYAPPDKAYPAELAAYPAEEEGYQNHEGLFHAYAERPELLESLPMRGKVPTKPYDSFVVYVERAPMESLASHGSRKSSIDLLPSGLHSKLSIEQCSHENSTALSSSVLDPMPRNEGRPFVDNASSTHGATLNLKAKQETKRKPTSSSSKDGAPRVDPWDLDARLAALNSKRPKSPTSSSSSYGSPHSVRSRASSWSNSPGGHIPGTNRDVLEFPFGYPTTPN